MKYLQAVVVFGQQTKHFMKLKSCEQVQACLHQ